MPTGKALEHAQNLGLDLVEVTSAAKPPVVKIIDFQKFKYQEDKKEHSGHGKSQDTKEIRFSPFMAENDLATRVNKAKKFLEGGDRVKLVVKFTGRQMTKKDFGDKIITAAINRLSDVSTVAEAPKLLGKLLIAQIKPKWYG